MRLFPKMMTLSIRKGENMMDSTNFDLLIDYVQENVSESERQAVEDYIAKNPQSDRIVSMLKTLQSVLKPDDLYTPSDKVWDWVKEHPLKAAADRKPEPIMGYLKGQLEVFKSLFETPVFGPKLALTRGSIDTELTYEAGPYQINLEICSAPQSEIKRINGGILVLESPTSVISSDIRLEHLEWDTISTQTDELGSFVIDPITCRPDDIFTIAIEIDDQTVYIENVPLGLF